MVLKYGVPEKHINLQGGWPTPRLHPAEAMEAAATRVFASSDIQQQLRYGPGQGQANLRNNIASWLSDEYQPRAGPVSPERILVTNGASNGLATILQKFADPGYTRNIWMVEPTYHLACPIFRDAGFAGRIRAVPEGARGVDFTFLRKGLEDSEKRATLFGDAPARKTPENGYPKTYRHILYMVPTFSNPSGKTMTLGDRMELVHIARKFDVLLVTDDVYDVLRWCPEEGCTCQDAPLVSPPRLVDMDRLLRGQEPFGNAISNGSFSKIVAPGVRVGWMEGTPDFVKVLSRVGASASGGNQAHMASLIIGQLFASGDLQRHLREVLIPTYRTRYYSMVAAIRHYLYPLGVRIVTDLSGIGRGQLAGGFFLYILFPQDGSSPAIEQIHSLALEHFNLRIAPGGLFTVSDDTSEHESRSRTYISGARLCWAWHEEDELVEGIQRLAEALKMAKRVNLTEPRKVPECTISSLHSGEFVDC
ncbi:putative Pyridoxal phosphate-dependent transferase [Seiridium cardinale]